MPMTSQAQTLNRLPLRAFPGLFATLVAPAPQRVPGFYRAEFVGPGWLRAIAPRGLVLIHLGGWWGKELREDGAGFNLVRRGERLERRFTVRVATACSLIDGKPAIAVRYGADTPLPWPYVVDELRGLDDDSLLGMTIADASMLRGLPLPFLLHRTERPDGL